LNHFRLPAAFLDPAIATVNYSTATQALSLGTPNIRECGPGQAWMLALETRVLDGRANGGWRVMSLADFTDRYPGTCTKKAEDTAGINFQRGGKSDKKNFFWGGGYLGHLPPR
jgi:hypothetical protein